MESTGGHLGGLRGTLVVGGLGGEAQWAGPGELASGGDVIWK